MLRMILMVISVKKCDNKNDSVAETIMLVHPDNYRSKIVKARFTLSKT